MSGSRRIARLRAEILYQIFLFVLGLVMVYPVLWMVANSFKPAGEIFGSASLFPRTLVLENYIRGWRFTGRPTFTTFYRNSFFT